MREMVSLVGDRRAHDDDNYVRAKTGPGRRDWTTIGVAFARRNDEPGFSAKLKHAAIDKNWNGSLIAGSLSHH